MRIMPNGMMMFDDIFELNYELLNEMELEVRNDGTVFDSERNVILALNDNIIKASIRPDHINYAGQNEISMDILTNIRLVTMIFGLQLQKKMAEGMPFMSYYQEETEREDIKYTNLTVKQTNINSISSKYYHNKCLKFIEMIFLLNEQLVDLSNFDVLEVQ